MSDKEICFKYYALARYEPDRFEGLFALENTDRTGYPVYNEAGEYTVEELKLLHPIDQYTFHVNKRRYKRTIVQETATVEHVSTHTAGERPVSKGSPTAWVKQLVVGQTVVKPVWLAHHSVYTACKNNGMRVSIRDNGKEIVVTRLS